MVERLPCGPEAEEKKKRKEWFDQMDGNGNGYLSLAEIDKGIEDVLGEEVADHVKPALQRAFQAAKDASTGGKDEGMKSDYVIRREFRLLLVYLKRYFELLAVFDAVDSGNDRCVPLFKSCPCCLAAPSFYTLYFILYTPAFCCLAAPLPVLFVIYPLSAPQRAPDLPP